MEVEFLSNMRYTLYASDVEWSRWHRKLRKFWDYFDKASKTKHLGQQSTLTSLLPTLPSPPASIHTSPPIMNVNSPSNRSYLYPSSVPPYLAPSIPSPVVPMPEVDLRPSARKRSYDDQSQERPSKRLAHSYTPLSMPSTTNTPNPIHHVPRLPVPNLSISTSNHHFNYSGAYSAQLPPPSVRAMSTIYPGASQWTSSGNLPTPNSQASAPLSSLPPMSEQQQSQQRPTSYSTSSRNPSPTSNQFPFNQISNDLLSPSGFPVQRNSPYRPLRGVNTLLVPPPSASMHDPTSNINTGQMHYQPLGKPLSERKTGVLPVMQHEQWPYMQQTSHWPSLPQPNFHN